MFDVTQDSIHMIQDKITLFSVGGFFCTPPIFYFKVSAS